MKGGKILFLCFLMCLLTWGSIYWVTQRQFKSIAVVDAVKLFDQFDMKKELEAKAKVRLERISKQMDSVGNVLKLAKATKDEEQEKKLSYTYSYIKAELENEYKQSNHDINDQVWKRLNVIVDEFGKKKGLRLIIGANGMGSVLFEDDYYDLTNELVKYANKKYEEGN